MAPAAAKKPNPLSTKKEFLIFMSIPIGIMLIVLGFVLIPSWLAHPKYNFIYSYCPDYNCSRTYDLNPNGIISLLTNGEDYGFKSPDLYLFDAKRNASQKISLADTASLRLDSSNVSPDGYVLENNSGDSSGFLFWSDNGGSSWYLKHGLAKKQIHLAGNTDYNTNDIQFLGWVE